MTRTERGKDRPVVLPKRDSITGRTCGGDMTVPCFSKSGTFTAICGICARLLVQLVVGVVRSLNNNHSIIMSALMLLFYYMTGESINEANTFRSLN